MPISCIGVLFLEEDLQLTLCRILGNRTDLVFAANHVGRIRQISAQVNRIKFAACGTETASDAAVEVNNCRTAGETAVRLFLDLFLSERQTFILEGHRSFLALARNLTLRIVIFLNNDIVLVQLNELTQVARDCLGLTRMYTSVHGFAGKFAACDRIDRKARTMVYIRSPMITD